MVQYTETVPSREKRGEPETQPAQRSVTSTEMTLFAGLYRAYSRGREFRTNTTASRGQPTSTDPMQVTPRREGTPGLGEAVVWERVGLHGAPPGRQGVQQGDRGGAAGADPDAGRDAHAGAAAGGLESGLQDVHAPQEERLHTGGHHAAGARAVRVRHVRGAAGADPTKFQFAQGDRQSSSTVVEDMDL
ncbi:hypothetical protein ON010_g4149 [Phytophthora cinnamomi]|nr:hypothetical protein ON010_g4149 [Phytophthora cinnamomi]